MAIFTTAYTNTTLNLSANNDDLILTNTGSVINDGGAVAVQATGNNDEVTLDSLVYSEYQGVGIGVYVKGTHSTVNVDAQVYSDNIGIYVQNGSGHDSVSIGAQGAVDGGGGIGVFFTGDDTTTSATYDRLSNAGDISTDESGLAVAFTYGGNDVFTNSGQISGDDGIGFSNNVGLETVVNSGTINAGTNDDSFAISSSASPVGVDLVNSGLITGSSAEYAGAPASLLWFDDGVNSHSTIDNEGTINGSGYVIQSRSDILAISNSGTIHGGLYSKSIVDLLNTGLWAAQGSYTQNVFDLTFGGSTITNGHSGTIEGGIELLAGTDVINNAGAIDGGITFEAPFGGSYKDSITNSGEISGALSLAGNNTLTNSGDIYGNVASGGSDTLINTGLIQGNVNLGSHNTFAVGDVTGVVTTKSNDVLEFSGNFGNQTIKSFIVGTASTHDTIQFAANDFSTYAQVQAASTQQGIDVVIRLDATDSITLTGVTLSSLASADFRFA